MNKVIKIINENKDKKICVVGTTCTGKSTLIKQLGIGIDMDEIIFPLLNEEEISFVNQIPWTPEIGTYMDNLVKEKIKIEYDQPVFGTVIIPSDLIIYLDIDEETLKQRCESRNVDFNDANNMNSKIQEELATTTIPIIRVKITTPKFIKDVEHVQIPGTGHPIYSKEDIAVYFELPLLDAGVDLYEKNIKTVSNNTGDGEYQKTSDIEIDFNTLNETNKSVAIDLIKQNKATISEKTGYLMISVATSRSDTVEDIRKKMLDVTSQFQIQDILYGRYNFDQASSIINFLRKAYGEDVFNEYYDGNHFSIDKVIEFFKDTQYMPHAVFDNENNLIWEHENYSIKHKNFLNKQEEIKGKNI